MEHFFFIDTTMAFDPTKYKITNPLQSRIRVKYPIFQTYTGRLDIYYFKFYIKYPIDHSSKKKKKKKNQLNWEPPPFLKSVKKMVQM